MFDVDVDLEANDRAELGPGALKRRSCRLRFLPGLSGAYTGKSNDSIVNTNLQHGLKRHPSTQIWKAHVCSFFSFNCQI